MVMKLVAAFSSAVAFVYVGALSLQPPIVATATFNSTSPELTTTGDNEPILRPWLDSLPNGTVVTLPAGEFPVYRPLRITKSIRINGAANLATTIKGVWADSYGYVLEVGDYNGGVMNNNVTIAGLKIDASGMTGTGIHNCILVNGNDFTLDDSEVRGSHHEGLVVGGLCWRATVNRSKAVNCGNGNVNYTMSTAGFNSHARDTVYNDCETIDCGQGFEVDGWRSRVNRARVVRGAATATPSIGINVGSTGMGINDIAINGCTIEGYQQSFACGNGIGRLASVALRDCVFDGTVNVMGGATTNTNPAGNVAMGEGDSPDTGQSLIERCTFIVRPNVLYGVLGYNGGPDAGDGVYGREPFTFRDCAFYFTSTTMDDASSPIIFAAGRVDSLAIIRPRFYGLNTAPTRGDFQSFSNNANQSAPGAPGVTIEDFKIFTTAGSQRTPVVIREGSP